MGAFLVRLDPTTRLRSASHRLRVYRLRYVVRSPRSLHPVVSRWPGSSRCRRCRSEAVPRRPWSGTQRGVVVVPVDGGLIRGHDNWLSDAACGPGGALYVLSLIHI